MAGSGTAWLKEADMALNQMSWDKTFQAMPRLINARISASTKSTQHVSSPAIWGGERPKKYDYLVVGAGFAGSGMAERLAVGAGTTVLLIDRRSHSGGNAHDRLDAAGVLIHPYCPHLFQTNSADILDIIS